jgi:hypothetical protein
MLRLVLLSLLATLFSCSGTGREALMTAGDSGNPQLDVAPSQDTTPQPNDAMPEGEVAGPDASVDVGPEVLVDSWSPDSGGFVDVGIVPDGGCLPQCINKECGIDGCGGFCGFCPEAAPECSMEGLCQAVPSSSDCKDIFSCFNDCQWDDANCYEECVSDASPQGQLDYQNLLGCLDAVGYYDCPDWDENCQNETLLACSDEYYGCFHGDLTCLEMYLCTISCPGEGQQSQECTGACYANATVAAQQLWGDVIECLQESGYMDCPPEDVQCATDTWEPCQPLYLECAHGMFTCTEVMDCMGQCGGQDQACYYECYFNGSLDAQDGYSELTGCIQDACGDWGDPACSQEAISEVCADAYWGCYG